MQTETVAPSSSGAEKQPTPMSYMLQSDASPAQEGAQSVESFSTTQSMGTMAGPQSESLSHEVLHVKSRQLSAELQSWL
jgi:hypothetical protein